MTENKADPLREALEAARSEIVVAIAFLSRDTGTDRSVDTVRGIIDRLARADAAASAALAAQPAAPLGGRDEIARIIFGKACGLSRWDDAFYAEERHGCLETADAILAAIPQELGDVDRLLQATLAEYEQTVEAAEKDTALSDTGRQRVIECCLDARGAVKVFAARLLAQESARPALNIAAVPDLKTDPELLALIERSKNHVMTPAETYEQQRSFARGACPSNRNFKEWCAEVDRLLPPGAVDGAKP